MPSKIDNGRGEPCRIVSSVGRRRPRVQGTSSRFSQPRARQTRNNLKAFQRTSAGVGRDRNSGGNCELYTKRFGRSERRGRADDGNNAEKCATKDLPGETRRSPYAGFRALRWFASKVPAFEGKCRVSVVFFSSEIVDSRGPCTDAAFGRENVLFSKKRTHTRRFDAFVAAVAAYYLT